MKTYSVNSRKHPEIKTKHRFTGTKKACLAWVAKNMPTLKKFYDFGDSSFCGGDGAYFAASNGTEAVVSRTPTR